MLIGGTHFSLGPLHIKLNPNSKCDPRMRHLTRIQKKKTKPNYFLPQHQSELRVEEVLKDFQDWLPFHSPQKPSLQVPPPTSNLVASFHSVDILGMLPLI